MSYAELARITATPLDKAVDRAINEINAAAIAEWEAEQEACAHKGGIWIEWYGSYKCDDCGKQHIVPEYIVTQEELEQRHFETFGFYPSTRKAARNG